MELRKIISNYREENRISQREFARRCGLSNSLISILEMEKNPQTGKRMAPDLETYKKLAEGMGIRVHDLFEMIGDSELVNIGGFPSKDDDFLPSNVVRITESNVTKIPLIGSVAAGQPILADESYDVFVDSPVKADYALRVTGNSMEPTYYSDDILYIRQTPDVPDGKIAIVLIDDEACVKHVYHIPNGVMLTSDNPAYQPMTFTWPEHDTIRVLGAVVGFTRMYK